MAFTWIPFYREFAQKLLPFTSNREPLVDWIYSNLDSSYIKHLKSAVALVASLLARNIRARVKSSQSFKAVQG